MSDKYDRKCQHEDRIMKVEISSGKNLLGKKVKARVERLECIQCHGKQTKFVEGI